MQDLITDTLLLFQRRLCVNPVPEKKELVEIFLWREGNKGREKHFFPVKWAVGGSAVLACGGVTDAEAAGEETAMPGIVEE